MSSTQQGSSAATGSIPKKSTRRSWTQREETVLISAIKELIANGWKSDNGFRAGYLNKLESSMKRSFPGSDLRALPHINSKIQSWKKNYYSLLGVLKFSGVGWNGNFMIEAQEDQWENMYKADNNSRSIRGKMWPYYDDWCEIFGKDRATGENAEDIQEAQNELEGEDYPMTDGFTAAETEASFDNDAQVGYGDRESQSTRGTNNTTNSGKKRKMAEDLQGVCELLSEMNRNTNERLDKLANRMGYEFDMGKARQEISKQLKEIPGLSRQNQYWILEQVAFKAERLEIWKGMDVEARADYVEHLLENRDA